MPVDGCLRSRVLPEKKNLLVWARNAHAKTSYATAKNGQRGDPFSGDGDGSRGGHGREYSNLTHLRL